ncbi:polysaccharide biosynthesis tyrosine autokinase [Nitrincola sp.]|uniref:polysaccharide biosynthesis tyrosine autokinase n=1 Tax=Nitrincola sp. TaxID=1926584 RepID=UPI003A925233
MTKLNNERIALQTKQGTDSSDEIDLGKLFGILVAGWKKIIAITFAFALIGIAVALSLTPQYQADSMIQVEKKAAGIPALENLGDMFASESSSKTEIELLKSRRVLGAAVEKLGLDIVVEPKYFPFIGKAVARRHSEEGVAGASLFSSYAWGGELLRVTELQVPRWAEGEALTLVAQDSNRFSLIMDDQPLVQGTVGERASGSDFVIAVTDLVARPGTEFSVRKLTRFEAIQNLEKALAVSEAGKDSGILNLSLVGENRDKLITILDTVGDFYFLQNVQRMAAQAEQSLKFLSSQLPQVKSDLDSAEQALNQYQLQSQSIDLTMETEGVLKQLVTVDASLTDLSFKEAELKRLYTEEHPTYKALREQRDSLLDKRNSLTAMVESMPETMQETLRLRRDVEVNQQIYLAVLNQVQELQIMKAGTVGNVRIVDRAEVNPIPVKPKKPLIVVLATMLGGMIAVAGVLVTAMWNKGIETPEQIEELGLSVYASVTKSDGENKLKKAQQQLPLEQRLNGAHSLLALDNPADLAIEALRSLRTSLHFAMMDASNNVLMISGPAPSLGKSFVSTNLAAVLAQGGQRVLVIDADMRKGYMQRIFGAKWDDGLSDLLAGKVTREVALRSTPVEGLDFIPRGQVPPNPSELLMHKRFQELVEWASGEYDVVVIDTPPILAVTDAAIVGKHCGTSVMVCKHLETTSKELEFAANRFETNGVHINGVILNQLQKMPSAYGQYGYYQYEYSNKS